MRCTPALAWGDVVIVSAWGHLSGETGLGFAGSCSVTRVIVMR
jgi:hypothetical protein